ncbi:MAG: hypothetical protein DWQ01_09130 [Planctomycetota bacterium]|nr:MAG: hypothetical protein DWQ01_09130 [Planctomycetota bacterium]
MAAGKKRTPSFGEKNLKQLSSSALAACSLAFLGLSTPATAQKVTQVPPMMRGDTSATEAGWTVTPLFTVGEAAPNFTPVGETGDRHHLRSHRKNRHRRLVVRR